MPKRRAAIDHDVYICCVRPASDLARSIANGLANRGFHVASEEVVASDGATRERLALIEEAPDFVVLFENDTAAETDASRAFFAELRHAVATGRNIVPVYAPGWVPPPEDTRPHRWATPETWDPASAGFSQLSGASRRHAVTYDPRRELESLARIAHRLSSDATVDERRMMGQATRVGTGLALVVVALVAIAVARALPRWLARGTDLPPLPPLVLYWSAFGQRAEQSGGWVEFPVEDGREVNAGDQIRLTFSASTDSYAYVVSKDLRGEVTVLFPDRGLSGDSRVRAGDTYEAPVETKWLTVDPQRGVEAIYVVGCYDPLDNLESLVEERVEESTPAARLGLLESTISGLVDGRHATAGATARTRRGQAILMTLQSQPAALSASATLDNGIVVTHRMAPQQGLLSAAVEIRLRFRRP